MPYQAQRRPDRIELRLANEVVAELRWSHNRLHYHPGILRLSFQGFDTIHPPDLAHVIDVAFLALRSAMNAEAALLLRVTLDEHSMLLPHLKRCGLLETRRVYEPVLPLDEPTPEREHRLESFSVRHVQLLGVSEAHTLVGEESLERLFWEVYARVARLDPATPERLSEEERTALALGNEALEWHTTTCAFVGSHLAGICCIYRSEAVEELEIGPIGVAGAERPHHHQIAVAMLGTSIMRAKELGGRAASCGDRLR